MPHDASTRPLLTLLVLFAALGGGSSRLQAQPEMPGRGGTASTYEDLVDLFVAWRTFHAPEMIDGVPDYTKAALTRQHRALAGWQRRLAAFDTTAWPIAHQVDWYLVWAEMNGLDFAHRVKQPWARDPAFYVWFYPSPTDVPEREGPNIHGAIELPNYAWPLSEADAEELADRLRKASAVFEQARVNLTGTARDLWVTGTRSIREQSAALTAFVESVAEGHPALAAAAHEARDASDRFADWLAAQSPSKTNLSGVGKDHYTWNLRNVHLLPYAWNDEVLLMQRELVRAHSALRLEEHRNRDLPGLSRIDNAEDYDRLLNEAVTEYMTFLEEEAIVPIKPYMDAALRAQMGRFEPSDGLRGFFSEITYRDPIVMRTHHYHWFDLARMREEPNESPIRRTPLLYNIFDGRAEGLATGMEEMLMHAGLLDDRPRARELVYVLLAQRAARALAALRMHAGELTLDEAVAFTSEWTPRGWLREDGETGRWEQHLYLQQPGYGTSYVVGKIEVEKLLAERARQLAADFTLRGFMDEVDGAGLIPVSLIRWELTGDAAEVERMTAGALAP